MAMKRQEQGAPVAQNGMMVAELKHLRAQVAAKELEISNLKKELTKYRPTLHVGDAKAGPVVEIKPQL